MTAFGAPLAPMELTPQKPGPGEALVRVTRAGLCHSDLHIHDGYFDFGDVKQPVAINMPAILGHEIEGEVAELGAGVTTTKVGERVAVYPWLGCNACDTCRAGDQQLCIALPRRALGVAQWGGMAEYVHVPFADALIPIGDLAPGLGALAMCSGLTAYSALKKIGAPPKDQPILLLGMGGVGLQAMALAKNVLPNPIIAADIDATKREAALKYGAVAAIEPTADAWADSLARHGPAAAAIDFVGAPATFGFGTAALRRGGRYIIVGLFGGKAALPLASLPLRPISIVGSYVGRLEEARELIALLRKGAAPAPPMHERPLDQANSAIADLRAGKVLGRVLLTP
ncbi:alcohol dehydrogenase catalytic domain-containing protein [Terricaulis sp.]|uniref:alcohol dehydrogenase catalytic domain-containing protein n=1 Tax=Terricaulis sp. TaxID=2768686 RepID=UPI003784931F